MIRITTNNLKSHSQNRVSQVCSQTCENIYQLFESLKGAFQQKETLEKTKKASENEQSEIKFRLLIEEATDLATRGFLNARFDTILDQLSDNQRVTVAKAHEKSIDGIAEASIFAKSALPKYKLNEKDPRTIEIIESLHAKSKGMVSLPLPEGKERNTRK